MAVVEDQGTCPLGVSHAAFPADSPSFHPPATPSRRPPGFWSHDGLDVACPAEVGVVETWLPVAPGDGAEPSRGRPTGRCSGHCGRPLGRDTGLQECCFRSLSLTPRSSLTVCLAPCPLKACRCDQHHNPPRGASQQLGHALGTCSIPSRELSHPLSSQPASGCDVTTRNGLTHLASGLCSGKCEPPPALPQLTVS